MKTILIIILSIIVGLVIIGGGLGVFVSNVDKGTEKIKQNEKIQDIKEQITTKIDSKVNEVIPKIDEMISPVSGVCTGTAKCITEKVTKIVDGDTIYTTNYKIRLSLTNTPERNESGFAEATAFTAMHCPVNSMITVDQDDLQPVDVYGRMLGKVYCEGGVINEMLLTNGFANILTNYCSTSEFSGESWAQNYGCKVKPVTVEAPKTTETKENCDKSYPDVCIALYPPDLNCGDIPYKNFRVVGNDPHRFDGDRDGIGCEK
ncbi:MAG: thermonuclease family protein [Nitrosarchaeum sp.]